VVVVVVRLVLPLLLLRKMRGRRRKRKKEGVGGDRQERQAIARKTMVREEEAEMWEEGMAPIHCSRLLPAPRMVEQQRQQQQQQQRRRAPPPLLAIAAAALPFCLSLFCTRLMMIAVSWGECREEGWMHIPLLPPLQQRLSLLLLLLLPLSLTPHLLPVVAALESL
jgi:hypothetical protein